MTAAGIGPKATGVILAGVPPLQQPASLSVKQKDRKGTVQLARHMGRELLATPQGHVRTVHQNHFTKHR
jgi:hypothetical protein